MEDYSLYLDETNVTSTNPFFCLGGIIIKRSIYETIMIEEINNLKEKYFGTTSIIFHYTEMKKNKNEFYILQDGQKRTDFWNEFNSVLRKIEFTTLGVYLEMNVLKEAYEMKNNKHYKIAFTKLINNYILFLQKNNAMGNIVFESRQWKENAEIQETFQHIINCGTEMYSADECKKYLSTIGFITKKDNCVGLQIADFVPDSFIRRKTEKKNFYNVSNVFFDKIFEINEKFEEKIGLVRIM